MVSYNGHHQFNSRIPECLPSFEVGLSMASQTTVARHASFLWVAFLHPAPLGRKSSVDFDGRPPKFSIIFHFFIGVDCMMKGAVTMFRMNTPLLFPKTKLAGSIIIQNTRHEITRWWRPPASTGKVLTYLWPNRRAHARSVLPRWPPWLFWSSLGLIPGVPRKVPILSPFCRFWKIFTRYFNIISLLSSINEL